MRLRKYVCFIAVIALLGAAPERGLCLTEEINSLLAANQRKGFEFTFSPTVSSWERFIDQTFLKLYPHYRVSSNQLAMCQLSELPHLPFVLEPSISSLASPSLIYRQPQIAVSILDDPHPNAYALPAKGEDTQTVRIVLTLGLLQMINNQSELAFVLAHEMAHLRLNHFSPHIPSLILSPDQLAHISHVHQSWEYEADREALATLSWAGFDKHAVVSLLERLSRLDEGGGSFFRKHPAIKERLAQVAPELETPIQEAKLSSSNSPSRN